jgi:hypothetical protein
MLEFETGQTVVATRRIATNSRGYFLEAGSVYRISRVYPESIELRGDFVNRFGTDTYRDRMHSVPRASFHKAEPDWAVK